MGGGYAYVNTYHAKILHNRFMNLKETADAVFAFVWSIFEH